LSRSNRFLCDEMLQRVGRWLRAAGYDTAIAESGEADSVLLQQARLQQRLLLTRDKGMPLHQGGDEYVVLLEGNRLQGLLKELTERLAIDWHYRPFSRCMECNTPLIEAPAEMESRVPAEAIRKDETLLYCPHCDKVYWEGSHVKRMRIELDRFSRGEWGDEK